VSLNLPAVSLQQSLLPLFWAKRCNVSPTAHRFQPLLLPTLLAIRAHGPYHSAWMASAPASIMFRHVRSWWSSQRGTPLDIGVCRLSAQIECRIIIRRAFPLSCVPPRCLRQLFSPATIALLVRLRLFLSMPALTCPSPYSGSFQHLCGMPLLCSIFTVAPRLTAVLRTI